MKAALLTGPRRIEMHDMDEPHPDPGDVVVQVESVGICGTDLSIHTGKIPVDYPRVMGHEIVGTVISGGSEDEVATRVLVDPGISCGDCQQCREGRTNICTAGGLIGRDRDGGLRDLMAVPASNVHELPEGLDPATAPMIQVLATCVHAQRRARVYPGESVVVLGLGVTGLLHLQLAKLAGADLTIAADGSETLEVAAALPSGADLVIECVGTVGAFARAVEMVRIGGRILAYGTMTETSGKLPFYELYHKEISVIGARSARVEDFPMAIDAVASGRVAFGALVSERFPIDDLDEAIRAAGAPGALKVFVDV